MNLQLHEAPYHSFRSYAGKVLKWHGTDSEIAYQNSLKTRFSELKNNNWENSNIEILYRHNSFGFRDDEFDDRPCALALGCSNTQGIGVPENDTWVRVLSKMLGVHIWNLGVSGSSIDTSYRLLNYFIRLKPKFIALLNPPSNRFEICSSDRHFLTVMPSIASTNNFPYHPSVHEIIKYYIMNGEFQSTNFVKSYRAIQQICNENNTPLYSLTSDYDLSSVDLARDLSHPGVKTYQLVAEKFSQMIQKDIT